MRLWKVSGVSARPADFRRVLGAARQSSAPPRLAREDTVPVFASLLFAKQRI